MINQILERVYEFEGQGGLVYFVTLTVRNEKAEGSITKDTLSNFLKKLEYRGVKVSGYIWTKELQRRGVVHYHFLILTTERLSHKVVEDAWKKGFVFVQRVRGEKFRSVLNYLFKYMFKNGQNVQNDDKMRRKMGRGGILRFRCERFTDRVLRFSEFDYVGSSYYKGVRVKVYRCMDLITCVVSGRYGTRIDICDVTECKIDKFIEEFKYRPTWNGLARIMNDLRYLFLDKGERQEIIGYHNFDRLLNKVM